MEISMESHVTSNSHVGRGVTERAPSFQATLTQTAAGLLSTMPDRKRNGQEKSKIISVSLLSSIP